jgi:hypothetical protein
MFKQQTVGHDNNRQIQLSEPGVGQDRKLFGSAVALFGDKWIASASA